MSKYIPLFYTNVITCLRANPYVALAINFSWSGPVPENTRDKYRFYFHLGSALPTKTASIYFPITICKLEIQWISKRYRYWQQVQYQPCLVSSLALYSRNTFSITPGTTWMQEIIYCLQHGPGASERRDKSLDEVFPYLEILFPGMFNGLEEIKALPRPRLIKTHLHPSYFKRQLEDETTCPRFVVVLRNPKDVLTSYYHFHKTWPAEFSFPKDWDYFFGMFKEKRLLYGDYFDHILSWWKYRNHPRVLVVKYEDMKKIHWEISRKSGSFWGVQTTPTAIWKRS